MRCKILLPCNHSSMKMCMSLIGLCADGEMFLYSCHLNVKQIHLLVVDISDKFPRRKSHWLHIEATLPGVQYSRYQMTMQLTLDRGVRGDLLPEVLRVAFLSLGHIPCDTPGNGQ